MVRAGMSPEVKKAILALEKESALRSVKKAMDLENSDPEPDVDNSRKYRQVEEQIDFCQLLIAAFAILTLVLAVAINELCSNPDYINNSADESSEFREWANLPKEDRIARTCPSVIGQIAKSLQMLVTLVLAAMVVLRTALEVQKRDFHAHMGRGMTSSNQWIASLMKMTVYEKGMLTLELAVVCVHITPLVLFDLESQVSPQTMIFESPFSYHLLVSTY
jgi:hypothetical protein